MKTLSRIVAVALLFCGGVAASAQSNPYSLSYKSKESHSYGTFFAEYNPTTWHTFENIYPADVTYHGVSVGFSYTVPVVGSLGFDAGVKGQYFFRNREQFGLKFKNSLFSATVPINLMYDFRLTDALGIVPFAGVYGRYNFTAKDTQQDGDTRSSKDLFDQKRADYYGYETLDRLQYGWQVGVNLRISDVFTIGGAYWHDLNEIGRDNKLRGFNLMIGANF